MSRQSEKKKKKNRVRVVPAAGAVLYRLEGTTPPCAVVHRPRYDDWSLPKGKADPGESLPVTAVREIEEETGFVATVRSRLATTAYPLKENVRKEVTYWAALAHGGEFEANAEVDELRWLPVEEADRLVSYPLDRKVLSRFAASPAPDSVLMLVRHAKAGSRSKWRGDDTLRPLEASGRTQAEMLAPMLRAFGVSRLSSAPRLRCEQTLAPLAHELGAEITGEPALSDEAYADDPDAARARLLDIAGGPGVAAVCSQGAAIPGLVADLTARSGIDAGPTATKQAGARGLGFSGGRLVSADYYPSPLPVL